MQPETKALYHDVVVIYIGFLFEKYLSIKSIKTLYTDLEGSTSLRITHSCCNKK